jgi:hypothetical protein
MEKGGLCRFLGTAAKAIDDSVDLSVEPLAQVCAHVAVTGECVQSFDVHIGGGCKLPTIRPDRDIFDAAVLAEVRFDDACQPFQL